MIVPQWFGKRTASLVYPFGRCHCYHIGKRRRNAHAGRSRFVRGEGPMLVRVKSSNARIRPTGCWFISPNATFRKTTEAGPHDFFDAPPCLFGAPQPPDLFLAEGVLNRGGGRLAEMAKVGFHEERHQTREIVVTSAHGFSSP